MSDILYQSTPATDYSDRELQALGLAARGSAENMVVQNSDLWGYLQPVGKSEKKSLPHIDFLQSNHKYNYTINVPLNKGQTVKHLLTFSRKSDSKGTRLTNVSGILTVKVNGGVISKGRAFNLKDGDTITIYRWDRDTVLDAYCYREPSTPRLAGSLSECYDIGSRLGKGAFGEVSSVVHRQTRKYYVVKKITRLPQDPSYEISCLKKLINHPNVCKLEEVFFNRDKTIFLVMELCGRGDLLNYITKTNGLSQEIAREITFQISYGMAVRNYSGIFVWTGWTANATVSQYVHSCGIIHRDLKPENILMASLNPPQIKIADFGLAKASGLSGLLTSLKGTEIYIAPEFFIWRGSRRYDNRVDSWSVGVIVSAMLTGTLPIPSEIDMPVQYNQIGVWNFRREQSLNNLKAKEYQPEGNVYNFCESLLKIDPDERKTLNDTLQLPWIVELTNEMM